MRPDVAKDFNFSNRFLPQIKRILGFYLIRQSTPEQDMRENSDLVVLDLEAVRVACRIRRYQSKKGYAYWHKHGHEFTIRITRPEGVKTELEKLLDGFGDFMLYGFANQNASALHAWGVGDLGMFRAWWCNGGRKYKERSNRDGSSDFAAFDWLDLPPGFIVGTNTSLAQRLKIPRTGSSVVSQYVQEKVIEKRGLFDDLDAA